MGIMPELDVIAMQSAMMGVPAVELPPENRTVTEATI